MRFRKDNLHPYPPPLPLIRKFWLLCCRIDRINLSDSLKQNLLLRCLHNIRKPSPMRFGIDYSPPLLSKKEILVIIQPNWRYKYVLYFRREHHRCMPRSADILHVSSVAVRGHGVDGHDGQSRTAVHRCNDCTVGHVSETLLNPHRHLSLHLVRR